MIISIDVIKDSDADYSPQRLEIERDDDEIIITLRDQDRTVRVLVDDLRKALRVLED